jgi:hypothetical protein
MNQQVFNRGADQTALAVCGFNNAAYPAARTDSGGQLIAASGAAIPVTANNLNIRPLNGITDSVLTYGQSWAYDSDSGVVVGVGFTYFLTENISRFARNTYIVDNTGSIALSVTLQIAPVDNDNYYVNDGSAFDLLVGGTHTFEPSVLMKYARIRISALLLGSAAVYYFGQT